MNSVSLKEHLLCLHQLVPKTGDECSILAASEKVKLSEKITEILFQVFDISKTFDKEQQTNLRTIRELVKKAEKMELLSDSAQEILATLVVEIKEKGLSQSTAPADLKIITKEGDTDFWVNSDLLKENSSVFNKMLATNMREKKDNKLSLIQYPKQTIETLMYYLHAPSIDQVVYQTRPQTLDLDSARQSPIEAKRSERGSPSPSGKGDEEDRLGEVAASPNSKFEATSGIFTDQPITPELLDFMMVYNLEDLFKKLEPTLTTVLKSEDILKNYDDWLRILIPQKNGCYAELANQWIAGMTPILLDHYAIPFKLLRSPKRYEIPSEYLNLFFDNDTKDLLQQLPVILRIDNKEALECFKTRCQGNKEFLHIKLLCDQKWSLEEKISLQKMAEDFFIQLTFEKILPEGTTVFGEEQWEIYFGTIGEGPPLPENINELLESPCPFFPGKTWKETHVLTLVPTTVNGTPFHLNYLLELVKKPKGNGHSSRVDIKWTYETILFRYGVKVPERPYWTLMSKEVIANSRAKTYQQQLDLIKDHPDCEAPNLLTAATCILTHHTATGVHLFPKDPETYIQCQEKIHQFQVRVGSFADSKIVIGSFSMVDTDLGLAVARNFF